MLYQLSDSPGAAHTRRRRGPVRVCPRPDAAPRTRPPTALNDRDALGRASGDHAIRMPPPLVLSQAEADLGLARIERALATILG